MLYPKKATLTLDYDGKGKQVPKRDCEDFLSEDPVTLLKEKLEERKLKLEEKELKIEEKELKIQELENELRKFK